MTDIRIVYLQNKNLQRYHYRLPLSCPDSNQVPNENEACGAAFNISLVVFDQVDETGIIITDKFL